MRRGPGFLEAIYLEGQKERRSRGAGRGNILTQPVGVHLWVSGAGLVMQVAGPS